MKTTITGPSSSTLSNCLFKGDYVGKRERREAETDLVESNGEISLAALSELFRAKSNTGNKGVEFATRERNFRIGIVITGAPGSKSVVIA